MFNCQYTSFLRKRNTKIKLVKNLRIYNIFLRMMNMVSPLKRIKVICTDPTPTALIDPAPVHIAAICSVL